jgi:hypothetical protein
MDVTGMDDARAGRLVSQCISAVALRSQVYAQGGCGNCGGATTRTDLAAAATQSRAARACPQSPHPSAAMQATAAAITSRAGIDRPVRGMG